MPRMTLSQAKERVDRLKKLINDYRYHYHVLNESIMSEAAADSLKHELSQLEAQYPDLITPDSPTQRVAGEPLAGFKKVRHSNRMLSLNDVFNREEVEAWLARIKKLVPNNKLEFFVDLKMDGLACALVYQDGKYMQAITRGDGFVGEDVTVNVATIDSIPFELRDDRKYHIFRRGRTEIRGEIVMLKKDFEALNKKRQQAGLPVFANPRNLAAGTIRQLDPKLVVERPLSFRAYDLLRDNPSDVPSYQYVYEVLLHIGLPVNHEAAVLRSAKDIMKFANKWEEKRHQLPFNTDGLVVKVNDKQIFNQLGVVGKAPRAAIAYKYAAEEATTVVKDIVLSIGRTGAATPIATFDPVILAGTTVQHASLHNADEIARKDIRVGDTVVIFKAGDIIPQVSKVLTELRPKHTKPFDMEAELRRQYPELEFVRPEGEAVYRIKGASGQLLLKQALIHFASRGALDIDTLGEKNVTALVNAKLVHDLADIYALTKEEILRLDRFAEISAQKLRDAIAAKKQPPLARFIYGLGIRHVGTQTAIDLANHFKRLDNLGSATYEELRKVDGIGEIVAESILAWFADDDNQKLLTKFRKFGVWPEDVKRTGNKLAGKSFVVTGTLTSMNRDLAADKIRALGGTFQTSVGKDTDYLVVGEDVGETKLARAKELGIKQITETEFIQLLTK